MTPSGYLAEHARIIELIKEPAQTLISVIAAHGRKDRYAAFLSRCRTGTAHDFIHKLF
jgi:hypothetical protein